MENARRILAELEALKRQLLERYPEAAPAPDAPASSDAAAQAAVTDGDELPGQVAAHGEGAPPATRGAGPASAAVADAVQQELSKRMDTLRSQVWQEIVREELARLESSRLADEQGAKRRSHVVGAYNADYVLGAVDGYAHRDRLHDHQHDASRHSLHSSADNQRTSAAVHSARAKEGGGEDAGDSAAPPGEEDEAKASAPNGDAAGSTDDDEDADEEWVSVSENAYGAFIHVGLQSGLLQAWRKCCTMLIVSIVIAFIFALELIQRHQFFFDRYTDKQGDFWVRERIHICWIPYKLQIAASMIFITLIFNNIPGMVQAGRIALQATHHKFGDGDFVGELEKLEGDADEARPIKQKMPTRIGIFIFAVLTEVCTWGMILVSGLLFIFTSNTVDLVIRSTVAVMFVLNVDEIVFESCCPGSIKEDVEETKYRLQNPKLSTTTKDIFKHYFGVYVYLPLLLTLAAGLTMLGRHMLECQQHPFQQVHYNISGVII